MKTATRDRRLTAPATLSDDTRDWWDRMQAEYQIADQGGLTLLALAAEARDRMHRAAKLVNDLGEVIVMDGIAPRANPACAVERDARGQMLAALKLLHLDVEPLSPHAGRQGGK
jgi:hypothetical protein